MSQQKMREALDAICSAKLCSINSMSSRVEMLRLMDLAIDKLREALAAPVEPSGNSGEFAAPAGEQVGLTDAEIYKLCSEWGVGALGLVGFCRAVIAAHEAKRTSCSQTAKTSTCEVGCVDGIGKSEHVGGAA